MNILLTRKTTPSVHRLEQRRIILLLCFGISVCMVIWRVLDSGIQLRGFQPPSPKTIPRNNSSAISVLDMGISHEEWETIQKALDWPSPDQEITRLDLSTSPVHSTFSIMRRNQSYKIGEKIFVTILARDHNKNLKRYGGDYFQVKLFNSKLKASVYGEVVDLCNGTYSVALLLPWQGQAQVSVRLIHSSEVVQILKKYRESSFSRSHYKGYFEGNGPKGTKIIETVECNLKWGMDGSWKKHNCCCEYQDVNTGTLWQCERPKQLSCDKRVYHELGPFESPLNPFEKQLFAGNITNKWITGDADIINVLPSETDIGTTEKCRSGVTTPVPAGFYFKDVWNSFVCKTQRFSRPQMLNCLKNKIVYLMGDSTTRQWFEYLIKTVPGLNKMNLNTLIQNGPHMAVELKNNVIVHWRAHGLPIRFHKIPAADLHYISDEIDDITGGRNVVIVFTLSAHLVFHPLTFYVHKVARIRQSVIALLTRAPETTVMIKSGNTGHRKDEFANDWYRMQLDTVMREMFKGIGVVYLDVYQMTSCHYTPENIHPAGVIIRDEIDMFLSYVCPT